MPTNTVDKSDIEVLASFLDAIMLSSNANDLCRTIVHGGFSVVETHGCHLYVLDSQSNLKQVAGYGVLGGDLPDQFSAWDSNPVADCIRQKSMIFSPASKTDTAHGILAVPFLKGQTPIGCAVMTVNKAVKEIPTSEVVTPIFSKLWALFLETSGVANGHNKKESSANANGEDLTKRQIQILEMMAEGMSNVEIAREMLLSESSIRQETVRIYRALGVGGRAEASKKAKALGIISNKTAQAS